MTAFVFTGDIGGDEAIYTFKRGNSLSNMGAIVKGLMLRGFFFAGPLRNQGGTSPILNLCMLNGQYCAASCSHADNLTISGQDPTGQLKDDHRSDGHLFPRPPLCHGAGRICCGAWGGLSVLSHCRAPSPLREDSGLHKRPGRSSPPLNRNPEPTRSWLSSTSQERMQ